MQLKIIDLNKYINKEMVHVLKGMKEKRSDVLAIVLVAMMFIIPIVMLISWDVAYTNDREYSIEEIIGIYDCYSEEIYYDDQYNKLIEEKRLAISITGDGEYVGVVSVWRRGYGKYYEHSQSPRIEYQGKVVLSERGIQIGGHKGYIKTKTIKATETESKKRIREITIERVTYRAVIY